MKFLHTGDLHIGKNLYDFSMLEDQEHMLNEIIDIAVASRVDAVIVAGDVYDRAIPSAEAVVLLNRFLTELVKNNISTILISGNHDSPERIGFAGEILERSGIYIAGECKEKPMQVTIGGGEGEVVFVLLPFVKPSCVGVKTSGQAVKKLLSNVKKEIGKKYVLVTHYFVTNNGKEPQLSEAETTIHVGGLDNVEASLLDGYDYVALGHIHKEQRIGNRHMYYAGAPLQYAFSEAGKNKTVNIVELLPSNQVKVDRIPLQPIRQMRKIRGKLSELMDPIIVDQGNRADYMQVLLTDREELIDPIITLRMAYPNVMQIQLLKNEAVNDAQYISQISEKRKDVQALFEDFYETLRGSKPDQERMAVIFEAAKEAKEGQG